MTNPSFKRAHRDYVSGVLSFYHENDIRPGDPNEGVWHLAHYPLPRCLGGQEEILLLEEHHAVQGVLQSEEYQHCCVFNWEKKFLTGYYLDLFNKWRSKVAREHGMEGANNYWSDRPEERLALVKKAARVSAEKRRKSVSVTDRLLQTTTVYPCVKDAAAILGICQITLAAVARGAQKTMVKKRFLANYV